MKQKIRFTVVALISAGLLFTGCKQNQAAAPVAEDGPAKVEHLEGKDVTRVTLSEDAAKRLDLQTAAVQEITVDGAKRKAIPYAAILYDVEGNTWTYVNSDPQVFLRRSIKVDFIKGNDAILLEDLPAGTSVVIIGATELYGSESEFEEE